MPLARWGIPTQWALPITWQGAKLEQEDKEKWVSVNLGPSGRICPLSNDSRKKGYFLPCSKQHNVLNDNKLGPLGKKTQSRTSVKQLILPIIKSRNSLQAYFVWDIVIDAYMHELNEFYQQAYHVGIHNTLNDRWENGLLERHHDNCPRSHSYETSRIKFRSAWF